MSDLTARPENVDIHNQLVDHCCHYWLLGQLQVDYADTAATQQGEHYLKTTFEIQTVLVMFSFLQKHLKTPTDFSTLGLC